MITVAIPGGTSPGLGRSILEAIQEHPKELHPVVLSRKSSQTPDWLKKLDIEVRKVDYSSEDSLVEALQGVHTVICTLLVRDGTWDTTQIRILNASLRAGVSRFAPAEFGPGPLTAHNIPMLAAQVTVREACREAKRKSPDTFEYACFHVGAFMNYLGYGAPDEEDALHGFSDNWRDVWWHVKEMRAEIPLNGEGKAPRATLTEIRDVGRFVAAACLLPKGEWREDFSMVGETIRMDAVVKIAEAVRGRKMEVVYRQFDEVVKDKEAEADFYRKFWYELEEMMARDRVGEGILEPVLNRLCSGVKPISVEDYVRKYWSKTS